MANQQNEDFVSYSVTGIRNFLTILRFYFLLCNWCNKEFIPFSTHAGQFNPDLIRNTRDQIETSVNSMDKSFRTHIIDFETESVGDRRYCDYS